VGSLFNIKRSNAQDSIKKQSDQYILQHANIPSVSPYHYHHITKA
jgi:hypothetical protein